MRPKGIAACATLLLGAASVTAGDYHYGATLFCTQCHVMHYSQGHGYNPSGSGFYVQLFGGPHRMLLRQQVNDLCLYCHDNNGVAPDVLGVNTGRYVLDVRLAGFLNRLGSVGQPATGHTLDALATAPGSNPPWKPEDENGPGRGLNCINCHQQHGYAGAGNNAYRNLRVDPGNAPFGSGLVTYASLVNNLNRDVFQREATRYDESKVDFNEPNAAESAYGRFCKGCHTNFHGTPGDPQTVGGIPSGSSYAEFIRHPTAGVNIGAIGGGHSSLAQYAARVNKVKVMSETGVWNPPAADVTPGCMSCHKAHGNGNAFGLIYRSGGGQLTENGDTQGVQTENLCAQCHVQASAFAR